jgi:peptidyl-prolyl cis-trans isomerase A (cyclophilin A)
LKLEYLGRNARIAVCEYHRKFWKTTLNMSVNIKTLALIATIPLFVAGCSSAQQSITNEKAPATFRVNLDTSRGPVVVEVTRDDAPVGTDRFYNLVKAKYFDGARFFRVVPGFVVQFGLAADPAVSKTWDVNIQDDPVKGTNARGTLTFAATGAPNSRSTQLFINLADNARLDGIGFAPFAKVVSGMEHVDELYSGDGERPDQGQITTQGNAYIEKEFPKLDYIKTARIAE